MSSLSLDETSMVQCSTVAIENDDIVELNETFSVFLSTSNEFVDITQASAVVTIIDDDTVRVGWTSTSYTSDEPDRAVTVCAELTSGAIVRSVSVHYSTMDGTAQGNLQMILHCSLLFVLLYISCTGPQDFTEVSNTEITFQPSSVSVPQCREIQIEDDNVLENNETFQVILATSDRAVDINLTTATVNILDDDRKTIGLL